jgi:hypothetical protein
MDKETAMEAGITRPDRVLGPSARIVRDDPIPLVGPVLALLACGASSAAWLWFSTPGPNYLLNVAVSVPVLFFGALAHLLVEELRATSATYERRRHVPLLRSGYYAFAVIFTAAAMVSILFHLPVHARFALSRAAMDAFVADVIEHRDSDRPATLRVGWYDMETAPVRIQRSDGALMFHLAGEDEAGFTYSTTPIAYPGLNRGDAGSLGGGWYWYSDD